MMPDFSLEDNHDGMVCGLDEVGRGPLAGPVVAACVIIPDNIRSHPFISDLQDSKKLSKPKLKILNGLIHQYCHVGIAEHSPAEIDDMNILQASLSAMHLALLKIQSIQPVHALVDGTHIPKELPCSSTAVKKGDNKSKSIAAASIVAKFYRDEIMIKLAQEHPHYGWETNVGYGSQKHRDAILHYGITPHHRKTFAPVRNYLETRDAQNSAA